jgi:hypothetical protein
MVLLGALISYQDTAYLEYIVRAVISSMIRVAGTAGRDDTLTLVH